MTIKQKLILAIAACMLGLAGVTAALVEVASRRAERFAAEQAIDAASAGLRAMEQADVEKLDAALLALSAHPGLLEAFRAGDRARFLAVATPLFERLRQAHGVTHFYAHGPDRVAFARVHAPALFGDLVERSTLATAMSTRGIGAGKELGATAFALRVVEPWVVDGQTVGYLELGEEFGHFLGRLKKQTDDDYALLVSKVGPAAGVGLRRDAWGAMRARQGRPDDWDAYQDVVVVEDTAGDRTALEGARVGNLKPGGQLLGEVTRSDRTYARGLIPVTDASGGQVGGVVVLHDISQLRDGMRRARAGILVTLGAVAVIMALLLLALVQRLVFARLDRMKTTLEDLGARLAGGEYDVGRLAATGPKDEIGRFEEFFGAFLLVIGGLVKELTARR
jgi:hypothetical protein